MCGSSASRDARAVIAHRHRAALLDHLDRAALRGVLRGVVEQVVDGAAEPVGHPVQRGRLERDGERDVRRVPPRALDRLGDERVEPHVVGLVGRPVAARQLDQVGDQRRELLGLVDDVAEQQPPLLRREVLLLEQQLGVRAQGGHRRAQLVRGVGDELALGGLRVLEPVDDQGEAVGGAAAEERGERDAGRAQEQEHEAQPAEHAVHALERAAEHHRPAPGDGRGDDAHVLARGVAVREPRARVARRDRAILVGDRERAPRRCPAASGRSCRSAARTAPRRPRGATAPAGARGRRGSRRRVRRARRPAGRSARPACPGR